MKEKTLAYLRLCRPPNLPTAAADGIAGMAIAGVFGNGIGLFFSDSFSGMWLILASILLYAGGVVLNDAFDADLDKIERPERPIPMGIVSKTEALVFGLIVLALGVCCAFLVNPLSAKIAVVLALGIVAYDRFAKHHTFFGPLNMGICRALNLLLGMSILGHLQHPLYATVPLVFIAAITMISQGEVHGNNKKNILVASLLYAIVIFSVSYLHYTYATHMLVYIPFLMLFALMVFFPLVRAYRNNTPENIKKAVKAGVLSIIVLDAALATGFASWYLGLVLVLLLPLSILLAKMFAVT